jgi:hypothetical protein
VLDTQKDAGHVDIHHSPERIEVELGQKTGLLDGCVVHEHIETAELRDAVHNGLFPMPLDAHVMTDRGGTYPFAFKRLT